MSGTLSGLHTALSALQYQRVAMDVTSSNVANATTEGYTRRRVHGEAVAGPTVPARWSRYEGTGTGVRASALERVVDPLLDARARYEHGTQSFLDVRAEVLRRVESGVGEPSDTGVAAALADFRSSWHQLANTPGGEAARAQVIARASALADAVHVQSRNIAKETEDQQVRLVVLVDEVNTVARELAATNPAIASARISGVDDSALLDQRDQLTMRLAKLTGGTVTVRDNGTADVAVGGVSLVEHDQTTPLDAAALEEGIGGRIGGMLDMLNVTLPAYAEGLNEVAKALADEVNALHTSGYDLAGDAGEPLFTYDADNPAASLAVAITDRSKIAASARPGGGLDGSLADQLGKVATADAAYQRLVNGLGTAVATSDRLAATQSMLTSQVDGAREQLAGVNLDEEMVSMLQAQRAYEAASRVMTVVDSVIDTLINRTGLTR